MALVAAALAAAPAVAQEYHLILQKILRAARAEVASVASAVWASREILSIHTGASRRSHYLLTIPKAMDCRLYCLKTQAVDCRLYYLTTQAVDCRLHRRSMDQATNTLPEVRSPYPLLPTILPLTLGFFPS
jgi:hypothetical protein